MDIYWIPSSIHPKSIRFHQIYIFVIYSLDPGVGSSSGSLLDFIPDQINDPIWIQKNLVRNHKETGTILKNRKLNQKKGFTPFFGSIFCFFKNYPNHQKLDSLSTPHAFKIRSHTYRPGPFFASITDPKRSSGRSKQKFSTLVSLGRLELSCFISAGGCYKFRTRYSGGFLGAVTPPYRFYMIFMHSHPPGMDF